MKSKSAIDPGTLSKVIPQVHRAVENLLKAWDSLYVVERLLGIEITTGELSDLAGGIDEAADVRKVITRQHILEWLNDISTRPK